MRPERVREILEQTLADHRLTRSERSAVDRILEHVRPNAHELALYRNTAFELARETLDATNSSEVLAWLEDVMKLLTAHAETPERDETADVSFSPGDDCPRRISGLLRAARRSIDICVFTITDDRISEPIVDAHRRGVKVRIVTDDDKAFDPGSDIGRLERAGIEIRVDRTAFHMHHKFAIFDGTKLLSGSYNWTRGAAENNHENFLITGDVRFVQPFAELFERLWEKFG